jgi:hypothetical protein
MVPGTGTALEGAFPWAVLDKLWPGGNITGGKMNNRVFGKLVLVGLASRHNRVCLSLGIAASTFLFTGKAGAITATAGGTGGTPTTLPCSRGPVPECQYVPVKPATKPPTYVEDDVSCTVTYRRGSLPPLITPPPGSSLIIACTMNRLNALSWDLKNGATCPPNTTPQLLTADSPVPACDSLPSPLPEPPPTRVPASAGQTGSCICVGAPQPPPQKPEEEEASSSVTIDQETYDFISSLPPDVVVQLYNDAEVQVTGGLVGVQPE